MHRILIELPSWLGDTIMASPAIRNIIDSYKEYDFYFLGSKISLDCYQKFLPENKRICIEKSYFTDITRILSLKEFDIFLSFRNSYRSKILMNFIKAKKKYFYDKKKFNKGHQVQKYNSFVSSSLNINKEPGALEIFGYEKKKEPKNIIGINPGASYGSSKRWYPAEFSKLIEHLSSSYEIWIFGGIGEVDIIQDIEKYLSKKNIINYKNLAGKTSINDLIEKISELSLFITGDSGPMHIAAVFEIPTITIFGSTNDLITNQWSNPYSFIVKDNLICQPCMKRTCPLGHHKCMKNVSYKDVLDLIHRTPQLKKFKAVTI